jgi:hypothetical protein
VKQDKNLHTMSRFDGMSIAEILQTKECKDFVQLLLAPLSNAQKNMRALHFFETEDSLCHIISVLRQAYDDPEMQGCIYAFLEKPSVAARAKIPVSGLPQSRTVVRGYLNTIFKKQKDIGYQGEIVIQALMRLQQTKLTWLLFLTTLVSIFNLKKADTEQLDNEGEEFCVWLKQAHKALE